jgi:8-oxo-dGTP pyrophosphatase MutT (NUDIX family)
LTVLVVAAAIVQAGRVLAAQRSYPAELADCWEFPGGKVEPGEKPATALVREIREELGVDVAVHERLGDDVPLQLPKPVPGRLRLYRCSLSAPDAMPLAGSTRGCAGWVRRTSTAWDGSAPIGSSCRWSARLSRCEEHLPIA